MDLKAYFIRKKDVEYRHGKKHVLAPAEKHAYDPATHPLRARKFLFWRDGEDALLLVGDDEMHMDMARNARDLGIAVPDRKPDGAGNLMPGDRAKIVQWSTAGYGVGTPRAFRPTLMAMISPEALETQSAIDELDDEELAMKKAEEEAAKKLT